MFGFFAPSLHIIRRRERVRAVSVLKLTGASIEAKRRPITHLLPNRFDVSLNTYDS